MSNYHYHFSRFPHRFHHFSHFPHWFLEFRQLLHRFYHFSHFPYRFLEFCQLLENQLKNIKFHEILQLILKKLTKQNEETKSNTLEQFVESHETLYSSI